jgi:prepilin-type N-terminal cleavage/methylation domain-containing protein
MLNLGQLRDDESGFSLTELLTAMVIGSVILLALMTLMTSGFSKSAEVSDRAEAAQAGRTALDRMVTLIDSTICLDPSSSQVAIPPLIGAQGAVTGSDGNYIAFYGDLNGVSNTPSKYTLTYDASTKTITERRYNGVGTLPAVTWPSVSQTRVLTTEAIPAKDSLTGVQLPIFRYYKFAANGLIDPTPMSTPITQANSILAIRVAIAFEVISRRTQREDARSTTIEGQSSIGTPDTSVPNAGSCP